MTLYSPVVFTDDPTVAEQSLARGWRVVSRHPDNPQVIRLTGNPVLCGIPQPTMSIANGSLDAESTPVWNYVLNWLSQHVPRPMPVVAPNDWLTELALWAAGSRDWPFGVLLTGQPVLTPQAIALMTAAKGFYVPDPAVAEAFTRSWPAPVQHLEPTPLVDLAREHPVPNTKALDGVTRVLLVAYYGGPSPTVGVQRVNYWFEQMEMLSDGAVTVDYAVATPWPDAPEHVHRVPDLWTGNLVFNGSPLSPAATTLLADGVARPYPYSRQVAGFWNWALERYFDKRDDEYDVVILSGNPYPYFDFASYARRRWTARVILDYRDPFVGNPRHTWGAEAKKDAEYLEAGWNLDADIVTVVNQGCKDVTVRGSAQTRIEIVPNGFDERVPAPPVVDRQPGSPVRFSHAGQIYKITPPDRLLEAIAGTDAEFHQIGAPVTHDFGAHVVRHPRVPREEALRLLSTTDCGVTFIGDSGIETPTKMFDYLALGLDVLVLHRDLLEGTAMWEMLRGVEGVYWVRDDVESIREFLATYQPRQHPEPGRAEPFMRRSSTLRLIELIRELGDHGFTPPAELRAIAERSSAR
ncbi:glycosyltransferase family protein [Tessaracoccus sp. Y36]